MIYTVQMCTFSVFISSQIKCLGQLQKVVAYSNTLPCLGCGLYLA